MKEETKQEKIELLIGKIESDLRNGIVKEKPTSVGFTGCGCCAYGKMCRMNIVLPCMAHNRASKDSIYYSIV